jgi:hypothetical protein
MSDLDYQNNQLNNKLNEIINWYFGSKSKIQNNIKKDCDVQFEKRSNTYYYNIVGCDLCMIMNNFNKKHIFLKEKYKNIKLKYKNKINIIIENNNTKIVTVKNTIIPNKSIIKILS